jgi:predicted DsbA family dithiol-disulfide isomerase
LIEIYSSMECPYAYLAAFRLRQVWPAYQGRVQLIWRALSLEYINRQTYPKPLHMAEYELFQRIEPRLPWQPWSRPDWQWPATFWPAFEALACAQGQGFEAAFEMSWALRYAFFAENRCLSLRHEVLSVAEQVGAGGSLDLERFRQDWDAGQYKEQVLRDSRRGWRELKLDGSATLVLPGGQQVTNPAVGEIDFDEERFLLRSYTPFPGDPLRAYRELIDPVLAQP